MMLVWSPFLLLCLVSDKATGKKKKRKEKVLFSQPSSGGLAGVNVVDDVGFGDAPLAQFSFVTGAAKT